MSSDVQFEEENIQPIRPRSMYGKGFNGVQTDHASPVIRFLIKIKVLKNAERAAFVLIAIAVILVGGSIYFMHQAFVEPQIIELKLN